MRFRALACDYDGTLATHDRMVPEAVTALERARAAGVRLLLVTGRTFFDLLRVCPQVDLFDAVVAENGGVLYFPREAVVRDLGPPPPRRLTAELDARAIAFQAGRVVVGTGRAEEARVREALDALGMRLALVYNRAALMLLPPGISKGTGVREAIRALGLSPHDVLALGDAENDLDFFEASGWSACPGNAVPELRARADFVLSGENGPAVARAVAGPILGGALDARGVPSHRITLGWVTGSSEPVTIPERDVNVLIQGDPQAGKSWLTGVLVERLLERRYGLCVVDPEGDYQVLAPLPGVTWREVRDADAVHRAFEGFDVDPGACIVLDLSRLDHATKLALMEVTLLSAGERRRRQGPPHWIVLDEAHDALHPGGVGAEAADLDARGFCLSTYRPSWLRPGVARAMDVFVFARTTGASELREADALLRDLAPAVDPAAILPRLPQGQFLLVEAGGAPAGPRVATFNAIPRMTAHVRHLTKYVEGELAAERRFVFRHPSGTVVGAAASLAGFLDALAAVDQGVLGEHARRGDFSRWLLGVFRDRELGGQLAKIERRWARGEIQDLAPALAHAVRAAVERARPRAEEDA
jgi:hypothetical protein